jgi:signal transduction histidine kinase
MGSHENGLSGRWALVGMTAPIRDTVQRVLLPPRAPDGQQPVRGVALWVAILALAAYVVADSGTGLFPNPRFGVQPSSPHAALAITLITLGGARYAPAVFVAVLLGWALLHDPGFGIASVPAALGITAVYGAAAFALRRWARWSSAQVRLRDIYVLLAASVPVALLCGIIDAGRQVLGPDLPASALPLLTFRIFVANLLGLVVLAPLFLQLASGSWLRQLAALRKPRLARDAVFFLAALLGLLELVFGLRPLDEFRMSYLLFLPMIAVAMRHGVFGAVTFMPLVQAGLLAALMLAGTRAGTAFEFQLLMLTLAATTLTLGALSDERERAAASIAAQERTLRERGFALAEAQRMASTAELAAALAHDLSQPLSAIGTYASASQVLAARGAADQPRLVETLELITQESARAGQYLRRMRDFFRTGTMHEETVAVADLVEATHAHLKERLARAHVRWQASLEGPLPAVRVDAVQMGAVLGNLVINACDALSNHDGLREIRVTAHRVEGSSPPLVRVQVADSGPGIPAELRERLFRPLATTKPNGMGLGLALSRSIAERQGGHLWFDATRPQTTFSLDLRADA